MMHWLLMQWIYVTSILVFIVGPLVIWQETLSR